MPPHSVSWARGLVLLFLVMNPPQNPSPSLHSLMSHALAQGPNSCAQLSPVAKGLTISVFEMPESSGTHSDDCDSCFVFRGNPTCFRGPSVHLEHENKVIRNMEMP